MVIALSLVPECDKISWKRLASCFQLLAMPEDMRQANPALLPFPPDYRFQGAPEALPRQGRAPSALQDLPTEDMTVDHRTQRREIWSVAKERVVFKEIHSKWLCNDSSQLSLMNNLNYQTTRLWSERPGKKSYHNKQSQNITNMRKYNQINT